MTHTILASLTALLLSAPAMATEPLRVAAALVDPKIEDVYRVSTARVVLADYDLIKRDFVETAMMTENEIDGWLIDRTGYISGPHAQSTITNSPITLVPGKTVKAFRPHTYGRALVYQVGGGRGLIDAKGTGVAPNEMPELKGHRDGLATLGEVTREFEFEKLVNTVFSHEGSGFQTVESYAVVDWGFDVRHADGTQSRAGMILRQAHERVTSKGSMLPDRQMRPIEATLRRYGLTSAGFKYGERAFDLIVLQGTPEGAVVDFGTFMSFERFEHAAASPYSFQTLIEGPSEGSFLEPARDRRVSYDKWGYSITGKADPKMDNPWVRSHELANDLRAGNVSRAAYGRQFEEMVGSYRRALLGVQSAAKPGVMESLVSALKHIR